MTITVKDVSSEEVILTGGLIHHATLEQPAEYAEIETTAADALHADKVYILTDGKHFQYITSTFNKEFAPTAEIKALIGNTATPEQLAEVQDWLEGEGYSSEASLWDSLAEEAQDGYDPHDDGY